VIVPYRNRPQQLAIFLSHMHAFLQRKPDLHYRIYIVNQTDENKFNRAMLMNIGFLQAMADFNWTCTVFHDVDLLPEDDGNAYACADQPLLMSSLVHNKQIYSTYFGGVTALRPDQFRRVNGYSNMFWGWGAEDDDMYNRVVFHGLHVIRLGDPQGRYNMITHAKEVRSETRSKMLQTGQKR
jgi:predicted glycosyltransferase involved in capsule biosynthesis